MMKELIEKYLNEAVSKEKIMRHIRWEEYIMNFFLTHDYFMAGDSTKNINVKNGQKAAQKSMELLSAFFDSTPVLDQYKKQYDKEQKKLMRMK